MRVLITGGGGFLGSNIARKILETGDELFIFDNLSRLGSEKNLDWLKSKGKFSFFQGDIRNKENVADVIKKVTPDVIYHLAGQVAMTTSINNPRLDFEINALGSFNVLESVKDYSPDSIVVYSSTNKVYGDLEWVKYTETDTRYIAPDFPEGFSETTHLDFHSPYGCSKGCADQYMLDFHRILGLNTVVFRHSSMFGGRQFSTEDQGWIGWFCQKAIETKKGTLNEPFTISGNGKQVRDVLYADDMVNLYLEVVKNIDKTKGQAFNIGGGIRNSLSLLELFDILESEMDIKMQYKKIAARESDQKVFVADITKIRQFIGWEPKTDKFRGIEKMLQWVGSNE
ncbi:MAG: SDR family NAD(P)-dependent oxidoreductase [Methanoregula sp.]|nr:SDR family NAD(P)-dependent oxidoreductase [Methanoregula sp.]